MSAFVVQEGTMDRALWALHMYTRGSFRRDLASPDTCDLANLSEIGRTIYAMNIEAVCQRYTDCAADHSRMPGPVDKDGNGTADQTAELYEFHLPTMPPTSRQATCDGLSAVHCILYQCSEGDVPQTDLYRKLSDAAHGLAEHIINELPEWKGARWDSERRADAILV